MAKVKNQYTYFQGLERTIKISAAAYILLLGAGTLIGVVGIGNSTSFLKSAPVTAIVVGSVGLAGVVYGVFYAMQTVHQLGDVHIWLDTTFFGFLRKSNEIIFGELLGALEPDERQTAVGIEPQYKGALATSIFSHLASDKRLFGVLIQSGIFRYWVWYWIAIYGTFVFTALTVESFAEAFMRLDDQTRMFFTINWLCALWHLALSLFLGYRLVRMTRQTVDAVVISHRDTIATLLRTNMKRYRSAI